MGTTAHQAIHRCIQVTLGALATGGVVLSATFATAPAVAAEPAPLGGYLYESPSTALYKHETKWSCPQSATSILDCKVLLIFAGADAYREVFKTQNANSTLLYPLVGEAVVSASYDTKSGQAMPVAMHAPIKWDKTTNRAQVVLDLSKLYFSSFTDPNGSFNYGSGSGAGSSSEYWISETGYAHQCSDPRPSTEGDTPANFVEEWGNKFSMGCFGFPHSKTIYRNWSNLEGAGFNPLTKQTAVTSLRSLRIDVLKSPYHKDGDRVVYFFAGGGTNDPNSTKQVMYGLPDGSGVAAIQVKSSAFPSVIDRAAGTVSCVSEIPRQTEADNQMWEYDNWTAKSPSAQRLVMWTPEQPSAASCLRKNPAQFTEAAMPVTLSDDSKTISPDDLQNVEDDASYAEPNEGEPPFERPSFVDCINIDPFNFKFDVQCMWDSLFAVNPALQAQADEEFQVLMGRVPFNYLPLLFDTVGALFGQDPQRECLGWNFEVMTVDIVINPCSPEIAAVSLPTSKVLFTLLLASGVGTWVWRRFAPSFGSDN